MERKQHIIVFSHGFGTRKDDRGLFTDIVAEFPEAKTILFGYNEFDDTNKTLTVRPFSSQTKILNEVLGKVRSENPNSVIDIIGHSQGCLVAALAHPIGIRKIIFTAPSFDTDIERMINMFNDREGTEINLSGVSKLARKDGTTTIVPPEFWIERKNTNPIPLYNELSLHTELLIINAKQDDVLPKAKLEGLNKRIKVIELDADHQFHGEARYALIDNIKDFLS